MNIAQLLARRQKRLKYWQEKLANTSNSGTQIINDLLSTYRLLISKMAKTNDELEKKECEERLETIERELETNFESKRLMTSEYGVPAIEESL